MWPAIREALDGQSQLSHLIHHGEGHCVADSGVERASGRVEELVRPPRGAIVAELARGRVVEACQGILRVLTGETPRRCAGRRELPRYGSAGGGDDSEEEGCVHVFPVFHDCFFYRVDGKGHSSCRPSSPTIDQET